MREIKFRAWAFASKIMFFPHRWEINYGEIRLLPNTILMQFAGLKDKNGKEIYESDLVRVTYPDKDKEMMGDDWQSIAEVVFDKDEAMFGYKELGRPGLDTMFESHIKGEVIGNIYENPELMKGDL